MMKHTKHLLVLWAALLLGAGNAWGAEYVLDQASLNTSKAAYQTSDYTHTATDGSQWSMNGFGIITTSPKHIQLGKASTNYIKTPICSGNITNVSITFAKASSYYVAIWDMDGNLASTTIASKPAANSTVNFSISGNHTQLQIIGTRTSNGTNITTSNAATYIASITVTYETGSTGTTPSITQQPASATYDQGATAAALTITASGNPAPTYQWYSNTSNNNSNGTVISGATEASYTPSTATAGTFYYYCVATNSEGSASSNVATITVNPVTTYTVQWKVGGNVYTTGNPTTSVASGSKVTTLPTTPADGVIGNCANKFMGWSTQNIGTTPQDNAPADLFTTAGASPDITQNTIYYAVFATKTTTGGGETNTTMTLANGLLSNSVITWTESGIISIEQAKGSGTSPNQSYISAPRWYQNNVITFTPQTTITKVVITATSTDYATALAGSTYTNASANYSGAVVTITPTVGTDAFTVTMKAQSRISSIVIYYGGGTTYSDYVTQCVECTANTLSLTATETTVNLPETGGVDVNIASFVTIGNNNTDAVTYSGSGVNSSTGAFHADAKGDYVITISQPLGTGDPVICDVSKTFTVHVLATPVITLVADAPIKLIADCGQKATATVQVTAYNCGTNDVTITSSNPRVTVSPASFTPADGKVNGTVTLSYTASTGGDSENYSAEISARCDNTAGQNTISVTATKGGCTPSVLTFMDRGSQYKQINSHYAGQTLPANEVPDPTGVCTQPVEYIFDGWATATVDNGATSYEKVTFPYAINGNQTFYAVYKYVEDGALSNNYELISSLEELESGADYVIAAYVDQNDYALKNEVNSDGKATSVSVVCDENNIITTTDNTLIWKIEGNSTEGYTFYNALCNKYMDLCLSGTKVILSLTESPTYKYKITMTSDTEGITTSIVSTLEHTYNVFSYYDNLFNAYRSCGYNIYLYKRAIASKYTTSPKCCPVNLQNPVVSTSVADGSVTLNWTMPADADKVTDYTVTCVGGVTADITETSYTFTGLTNCTEYTFTVRANGDGTAVCPSEVATVKATPAADSFTVTFDYGAGAGSPASWTSGCGNTSVTLPEPTTLPDNHTFDGWYDGTTLYASGYSYTPKADITLTARYTRKAGVDVVEWDPNSVTIEIGVGGAAQVQIENEVTSGSGTGKVADELFFSKYFEATGNVKLVAVYNGTGHDVDVTNYTIKYGRTDWESGYIKLGNFTEVPNTMAAGEEVILYSTQSQGDDNKIMNCVSAAYPNAPWQQVTNGNSGNSGGNGLLSFAGDKTIALYDGSTLLDVIGAITPEGAPTNTGASMKKPSWGDAKGWTCDTGLSIEDGTEIGISTNRCLLVRKNTVKSGANAVAQNTADFATLCDEWLGQHVPDDPADNGVQASCDNFAYVGTYDYNGYYSTYQELTKVDLGGNPNADGTYTIPVSKLNDISCSKIRINVLDGSSSSPLVSSEYKVPIMVNASDVITTNAIFTKHKVADCSECDVVVLKGATLEKAPDGTADDRNEFRNMEVYAGGKLKVPTSATDLKVNKLVMRSKGDEVPVAEINGTLTIADKLYHAKRIDAARFYFFTLPYDCNVADITYYNGEVLSGNGIDHLIKYYDGAGRAIGQNAGHWEVYTGSLLEAGKGYIVAISASLKGSFESNPKKELLFPMTNALSETTTKTVAVGTYGIGDPSIGDNHKGWNLIGCPFMSNYSPIEAKGLKVGTYEDGTWDEGGKIFTYNPSVMVPYVTMPNTDGKTYTQKLASSQDLQPFRSFFVQVGKVGDIISDVVFSSDNRKAPRKAPAADAAVWVELTLSNATGSDATTVIVDDDKTTDYEIGADLEKMLGYAALPQFYSLKSSTRLAFNALPSASASGAVPLGFYAPASDTYTIAMNTTQAQNLEGVYLTDNVTGTVTNLLLGDYSFTSGRTLNDARFSLAVVRSVTAVDNVLLEAVTPVVHRRTLRIDNAPVGSLVRVYDTLGREVVSEQIDAETVVYQLQMPGVYHVQIITKDSKSVYKVVSY